MTYQRRLAIESVRARLQRESSPRAQMLLLVAITAACGFAVSVVLLHLGVTAMVVRYPVSALLAYVVFLGLVSLWLRRHRTAEERARSVIERAADFVDVPWPSPPSGAPHVGFGGGGGFSGGGGGTSWGDAPRAAVHGSARSAAGAADHAGGLDVGLDLDEGALWLIPVLIAGVLALGAVLYVVYVAPVLFAELLLDAGLAAGMYRRLSRGERRSWLLTAVRSTVVPACCVAGLLALAGAVMQGVYPDARSIGVVARHLREPARRAP